MATHLSGMKPLERPYYHHLSNVLIMFLLVGKPPCPGEKRKFQSFLNRAKTRHLEDTIPELTDTDQIGFVNNR